MRARFVLVLIYLFTLPMSSGCGLFAPKLPSLKKYRAVSAEEAATFRAAVRASSEKIQGARGQYQALAVKGVSRQEGKQVVVFQRPDKLRLELFASSLNQLVLMVVSRDGNLEALDPHEGVRYEGESTPQNIARIIGVPLLPDELMLWFAGVLALPADAELDVVREPDKGYYGMKGNLAYGRSVVARFESAPSGPRLLSLELRRTGDGELFFFSEFGYGDGELPEKIKFYLPEQELRGQLRAEKLKLNPENLPERLFEIPPRENVRTLPLGR